LCRHGTDGSFNQSASSIKMTYEAERNPVRVPGLSNVVQVAGGPHHSVALQADGTAFTWGCGGYGRLGHVDQADIYSPKALPNFLFRSVACGNAWSCGVGWRVYNASTRPTGGGILHIWGKRENARMRVLA
jgi:alpha-tubulin suppressor-like RCC1 family protein